MLPVVSSELIPRTAWRDANLNRRQTVLSVHLKSHHLQEEYKRFGFFYSHLLLRRSKGFLPMISFTQTLWTSFSHVREQRNFPGWKREELPLFPSLHLALCAKRKICQLGSNWCPEKSRVFWAWIPRSAFALPFHLDELGQDMYSSGPQCLCKIGAVTYSYHEGLLWGTDEYR